VDRKPPSRGPAQRGPSPPSKAAEADDFAVLERSYDWLPHFDDAPVVHRFNGISILRSRE
jgi:hypothetical protein